MVITKKKTTNKMARKMTNKKTQKKTKKKTVKKCFRSSNFIINIQNTCCLPSPIRSLQISSTPARVPPRGWGEIVGVVGKGTLFRFESKMY